MRELDNDERLREDERELDPTRSETELLEEQEVVAPEQRATEAAHFETVAAWVQAVLEGRASDEELDQAGGLTDAEREALEMLQEVVSGRDTRSTRIVYAERRLEMLELSLATLQPALATALDLGALRDTYDNLVEEVTELRERLLDLDDAQDDLLDQWEAVEEAKGDDDKPDEPGKPAEEPKKPGLLQRVFGRKKDEPAPEDEAEEAPRESSLYGKPGEPAVEKPATKSKVYEPD